MIEPTSPSSRYLVQVALPPNRTHTHRLPYFLMNDVWGYGEVYFSKLADVNFVVGFDDVSKLTLVGVNLNK